MAGISSHESCVKHRKIVYQKFAAIVEWSTSSYGRAEKDAFDMLGLVRCFPARTFLLSPPYKHKKIETP